MGMVAILLMYYVIQTHDQISIPPIHGGSIT